MWDIRLLNGEQLSQPLKLDSNRFEQLYIQYSHCHVVQLFRLTPLLTKAFNTIITKHCMSLHETEAHRV